MSSVHKDKEFKVKCEMAKTTSKVKCEMAKTTSEAIHTIILKTTGKDMKVIAKQ